VQRLERYSLAWFCRMPRAGAPNVVDVSTLVFSGRSLDFVGFGTQESNYAATFLPQSSQITIQGTPDLRRGSWILDATLQDPTNAVPTLKPRGFFYRVVSVNDNGNGTLTVEVQQPLRGCPDPTLYPTGTTGTVIVFDNLVEVFEQGTF
jgi:hypothetical protein